MARDGNSRPRRGKRWREWVAGEQWALTASGLTALAGLEGQGSGGRCEVSLAGANRSGGMAAGGESRLAVVRISGPMVARRSASTDLYGLVTYEQLRSTLSELMGRSDVGAVVLHLDTPGGQVAGLPELADQVHAWGQQKPIVAVADPMAASAGLYLASAATEFVVTPSGEVGSLGTLWVHYDTRKAWSRYGIDVTLVTSQPKKVELSGFTGLSDEARAYMQATVDRLHEQFAGSVARYRGVTREHVAERFGQGRMVPATEALAAGMVDRVATIGQVVEGMSGLLGRSGQAGWNARSAITEGTEMRISQALRAQLVALCLVTAAASDGECRSAVLAYARGRGAAAPASTEEAEELLGCAGEAVGSGQSAVGSVPGGFAMAGGVTVGLPVGVGGVMADGAGPTLPGGQGAPAAGQLSVQVLGQSGAGAAPQQVGTGAAPQQTVAGGTAVAGVGGSAPLPSATAGLPGGGQAVGHHGLPAGMQAARGVSTDDILDQVALTPLGPVEQANLVAELRMNPPADHRALVQAVSTRVQQQRAPVGAVDGRIAAGAAGRDRMHQAAVSQLAARAWQGQTLPEQVRNTRSGEMVAFRVDRTAGNLASMPMLMKQCLLLAGVSGQAIDFLTPTDLAAVMSGNSVPGVSAEQSANTRSMYSAVFADVTDLVARRSYDETPVTYTRWARQDESFQDFDPRFMAIMGELPDPTLIPENGEFDDVVTLDESVNYRVNVWGQRFSLTWQMQVGDRLGQFLQIPAKSANAFARKKERLAYVHTISNPTMADGTALFASRTGMVNTRGSMPNPDAASFQAGWKAMQEMRGLNADAQTLLGVEPKYLLCAPDKWPTALTFLKSMTDIGQSNPGKVNVWQNFVEPISVPSLATAAGLGGVDSTWYLVAGASQIDTLVYAALAGTETVRVEQEQFFNSLGMAFRMYTTFGCRWVDFRGVQQFTA